MLEGWLRAALEAVEAGEVPPELSSEEATALILDIARDAAHGVERPAAPLASFAAGFAIGRHGGGLDELRSASRHIATAAEEWDATDQDKQP